MGAGAGVLCQWKTYLTQQFNLPKCSADEDNRTRKKRRNGVSMKKLNEQQLELVSGGDNDGNAGEAEAADFYARYGTCERNAQNTIYTCKRADGKVTIGNVWS